MAAMRRTVLTVGGRPTGRSWTVLVLAVLVGLLAMHALAPGGRPAAGEHALVSVAASGENAGGPGPAPEARAGSSCRHAGAHGDGSHEGMDHAAGTCAAGTTGSGYVPPALCPGLTAAPDRVRRPGGPAARALHERAPPDLAELQLLRI